MHFYILIVFSIFFFIGNARAQTDETVQSVEKIILITPRHCLLLSEHIPDADVAYKPGIDARGRQVVPADIDKRNYLGLGEGGYSFLMTHDALNQVETENNNVNSPNQLTPLQEGKIVLGQVTVIDGDVLWNGQSLKQQDKNQIYLLCDEEKRRNKSKR